MKEGQLIGLAEIGGYIEIIGLEKEEEIARYHTKRSRLVCWSMRRNY